MSQGAVDSGRTGPTRRSALLLAAAAVAAPFVLSRDEHDGASVSVDLTRVAARTRPEALGLGCSTYGATPLSSREQAAAERRLDARTIRLPVGWRGGRLTSSAAGGPEDLDVAALVSTYRSWGYGVLVVLGGRTNDVDLGVGDAARAVELLGTRGVEYSSPNEPESAGGLEAAVAAAAAIHAEVERVVPGFRLWGPAWSHPDAAALRRFALAMGGRLAGVDYHHYGMGERSRTTSELLRDTPEWGRGVRQLRHALRGLGVADEVSVSELNLSWRYADGSQPGAGGWKDPVNGQLSNRRFFTAVNTVFLASVCGHVLNAGGSALPYATQDRALGMTVQPEYDGNPDDRPAHSPMPGYWGIAAWTGAGAFPHFAEGLFDTTSDDELVEAFAVENEDGGVNVVLISKHERSTSDVRLRLVGASDAVLDVWSTDRARPYDPYQRIRSRVRSEAGTVSLRLPAMTVMVVVVRA